MSTPVFGLAPGAIVHWDNDPSDRGVLSDAPDGSLSVLWFDEDCYVDCVDVEGWTDLRCEPNKAVGQYRLDGVLYSRRGKRLKRQTHAVIATGNVELDTLARARERLETYYKEEAA